jgi:hypothetical protein
MMIAKHTKSFSCPPIPESSLPPSSSTIFLVSNLFQRFFIQIDGNKNMHSFFLFHAQKLAYPHYSASCLLYVTIHLEVFAKSVYGVHMFTVVKYPTIWMYRKCLTSPPWLHIWTVTNESLIYILLHKGRDVCRRNT